MRSRAARVRRNKQLHLVFWVYVDLIGRRATHDGARLDLAAKDCPLLSVLRHADIEISCRRQRLPEPVFEVDFESRSKYHRSRDRATRAKLDLHFAPALASGSRDGLHNRSTRNPRDTVRREGIMKHSISRRLAAMLADHDAVRVHDGRERALFLVPAHAARTSPARVARYARRDRAADRPALDHSGRMEDGEEEKLADITPRDRSTLLAASSADSPRYTYGPRRSPADIEKHLPAVMCGCAQTDAPTTCSRPPSRYRPSASVRRSIFRFDRLLAEIADDARLRLRARRVDRARHHHRPAAQLFGREDRLAPSRGSRRMHRT